MATSLLRSGRLGLLKCLQLESWGVLGSRLPASFCTKAEEPEKPVKKAKASGKTAEAVDGREKLLAYRTRVVFPVRLSEPGAFPAQCQGVTEPVVSSTAGAKTFVASVPVIAASEPAAAEQEATKAAAPTSDPAPDTDTARVISGTAPPIVHTGTEAAEPVVGVGSGSVPPEETAKDKALPAAGASSEDSSSSSSSDSDSDTDSDSDSDSEDEDSAGKTETKTETKTSSPDVVKVTKEAQQPPEATLTSDTDALQDLAAPSEAAQATVEAPSVSSEELVEAAPETIKDHSSPRAPNAEAETPVGTVTKAATPETAQPTVEAPSVSGEELVEVEAAPETIKDHSSPGAPNAEAETPVGTVTKAATPETAQTDTPVETTETVTPETSAEVKEAEPVETVAVPMEATAEEEEAPRPAEVAPVETSAEGAAEVCAPAESTEELVDTAPVVAGAVGEELEAETPAEQSKEAAAAAAEPEEPFDNSTYKNCQHHSYNPYTFADLDLQMAKFRLPQPSSGRPSPRH